MILDHDVFIRHMKKISKPNVEDFGLICYTYNDGKSEEGYYNPPNCNIGDYIQSLAALQFLPRINGFIDRDQLGTCDRKLRMIMNAWYFIWKKNEIFSENIEPLLVSMHLNNPDKITERTLAYFKKHEPVGCRDIATRDFLREHGIDAYFSGCMTLTLGETYKIPLDERKGGIYLVDYEPENVSEEMRVAVDEILRKYEGEPLYRIKHRKYPFSCNPQEHLESAEVLIKSYAQARLVVTSRIHCALPCLGLDVPVVLAVAHFDEKRYQGLFEFFNYLGIGQDGRFINTVLFSETGHVVNRTLHEQYAERLKEMCYRFCGTEKIKAQKVGMPSLRDICRLEQYSNRFKDDSDRKYNFLIKDFNRKFSFLQAQLEEKNARVSLLNKKVQILKKGIFCIRMKARCYRLLSKITSGHLRKKFLKKRYQYKNMIDMLK